MGDSKGISYGQSSDTIVEKGGSKEQSACAVGTGEPGQIRDAGIPKHSGMWSITAQLRISCTQTSELEVPLPPSKMLINSFKLVLDDSVYTVISVICMKS